MKLFLIIICLTYQPNFDQLDQLAGKQRQKLRHFFDTDPGFLYDSAIAQIASPFLLLQVLFLQSSQGDIFPSLILIHSIELNLL